VLSGVAPADRAKLCMDSLEKHLGADVGYRLCAPPFTEYDPRVGRMSNSMPGHAENGGCYCHAAGFKGVADCVLGRAEEAWQTFVRVAPDNPLDPVSQSQVEPFSFTNFYTTVKQSYGRAGYPWRTGTAGWFTVLLVEWILGARRSLDGLLIYPCLSKTIPRASVLRSFRGAQYEIDLDNSAGRCRGARKIVVDGKTIDGRVLPVFRDGVHKVKVTV
jgi:cellobiose phosphorylase